MSNREGSVGQVGPTLLPRSAAAAGFVEIALEEGVYQAALSSATMRRA